MAGSSSLPAAARMQLEAQARRQQRCRPAAGDRLAGRLAAGCRRPSGRPFHDPRQAPALSVNGTLHGQRAQLAAAEGRSAAAGAGRARHQQAQRQAGAADAGRACRRPVVRARSTCSPKAASPTIGSPWMRTATSSPADLALHGALKAIAWNGTLSTLDLEPQGLPGWRLQRPSQLSYDEGAMSMSELCLSAGDPLLCAAASQDKAGNLDASYRLHALPLALIVNAAGLADLPMRVDGNLRATARSAAAPAGALGGHASISSGHGSISYTDHADQPLLHYRNLQLQAQLGGDQPAASTCTPGSTTVAAGRPGRHAAGAAGAGRHARPAPEQPGLHRTADQRRGQRKGNADGQFRIGGTLDATGHHRQGHAGRLRRRGTGRRAQAQRWPAGAVDHRRQDVPRSTAR